MCFVFGSISLLSLQQFSFEFFYNIAIPLKVNPRNKFKSRISLILSAQHSELIATIVAQVQCYN